MKRGLLCVAMLGCATVGVAWAGGNKKHHAVVKENQCVISRDTSGGPPNRHRGLYLEGNLGSNILHGSINILGLTLSATTMTGVGINGNIGYMFNNYVGVEGGLTSYMPSARFLPNFNSVDLALKVVIPLWQRFSIFGKTGVMGYFITHNAVAAGVAAYYGGAGVGYAFNKNLTFNVQVQGGLIPKWGVKLSAILVSGGLAYYF